MLLSDFFPYITVLRNAAVLTSMNQIVIIVVFWSQCNTKSSSNRGSIQGSVVNSDSVVLIVVNTNDIASKNQAEALLEMNPWSVGEPVEGHACFTFRHVRMWFLPDGLLFEDHVDQRWTSATEEIVSEVIFPSRHAAASGQASLTLHPIGVPHLSDGEPGKFGGVGGQTPPPNPRLGRWWKMLLERAPLVDAVAEFDLSLEVTHHGPVLQSPAMFIEVGSTQATWGHVEAARLLASIINDGLFHASHSMTWDEDVHAGQVVVITLGGGHYAPRANQLAAKEGVWLGHMLASYALPFEQNDGLLAGNWSIAIDEAIRATTLAFPGGHLVASMDKKSFRGWQRQAVRDHLAIRNIPLLTTKDIDAMLSGTS